MSSKLRSHIKRLNLKRSDRAKKKMLKSSSKSTKCVTRTSKPRAGTFKIKVAGEMKEYPVGLSGYVPKTGIRQ